MARYSKKHYEDFSNLVAEEMITYPDGTVVPYTLISRRRLIQKLATLFKQDNPNFDWDRFVESCK